MTFSYLTEHPHRPLAALDQGPKDSRTAISTMGCALSYLHHGQRFEYRERQRREEPYTDWSGQAPHGNRRGPEKRQRERGGRYGRHVKQKEREERDPVKFGSEELHREQRARAEPLIKQSGGQRLQKERRVMREPYRERRGQEDLSEKRRRREDVFKIGWAHPYVRRKLQVKFHEARGMRDETRRERYEPVRQAKENFRRQYDEYKNGNGVVPAPQRNYRNTMAPSTLNLSGMTLVNYHGIEVPILW